MSPIKKCKNIARERKEKGASKHTIPAHGARVLSDKPEEKPIKVKPYKQGKTKSLKYKI